MRLWDSLTGPRRGALYCWVDGRFVRSTWREVLNDAERSTAALRRLGVRPGSRVAAILTNGPEVVRGVFATWLAGGALASLPVPSRGMSSREYLGQLTAAVLQLEPTVLLVDHELSPLLTEELRQLVPVCTYESLLGSGRVDPVPPGDDDIAFIQYSSGSTSAPKGCALTTRAIGRQMEMILSLTGGRGHGTETFASWLPLSHDMGFFGCFLHPWAYDHDLVLSTPQRFTVAPRSWFRDMSEYGVTVTAGTNTALHLAVRAQRSEPLPRRMELRCGVIGAERVDWGTLQLAAQAFAPYGLAETALTPAYGMAEATLAATANPWWERATRRTVDTVGLSNGEINETDADDPGATSVVSCGPPVPGVEIAIDDESAGYGEIIVRSPSLAEGYHGDAERTARHFTDGGLRTGDLGFVRKGELYVLGRADDVLQVGGRTVYASEIEAAADSISIIRKGCAVIIGVSERGRDELILMAELKRALDDYHKLAAQLAEIATRKAGIDLATCLFLPKNILPKTPSGKIQRFRCRQLLHDGALEPLAHIRLAG